jgi:hypothetical protein
MLAGPSRARPRRQRVHRFAGRRRPANDHEHAHDLYAGKLHADFGGAGEFGIPYMTVAGSQPALPIQFGAYANQSDPGP